MVNRFLLSELAECAERELHIRYRIYPNRIQTQRMSRKQAEREIAMMQEIAELLGLLAKNQTERRTENDEGQRELFGRSEADEPAGGGEAGR